MEKGLSEGPSKAGFKLPYGEPAGLDTIRVFATTDKRTTDEIRGIVAELEQELSDTRPLRETDVLPGLEVLSRLRRRMAEVSTRGVGIEEDEAEAGESQASSADWAAAGVTIVVEE